MHDVPEFNGNTCTDNEIKNLKCKLEKAENIIELKNQLIKILQDTI